MLPTQGRIQDLSWNTGDTRDKFVVTAEVAMCSVAGSSCLPFTVSCVSEGAPKGFPRQSQIVAYGNLIQLAVPPFFWVVTVAVVHASAAVSTPLVRSADIACKDLDEHDPFRLRL